MPRVGLRRITLASVLVFSVSLPAFVQEALTLYTTHEPGLVQSLLGSWTKVNGIRVGTVYIKDGILERVKAEGKNSPADLLMTIDADNLIDLVEAGVTQPAESEALKTAILTNLYGADNQWFALSMRARMLYVKKSLPIDSWYYEQLANPEYKGEVRVHPGQYPCDTALIAVMIACHGEAKTKEWPRDVKVNLARKATGDDRDVARDILDGICDIGPINSYYVGHMKNVREDNDVRQWGDAIKAVKPIFENDGICVNISGAAVARYVPNKADAAKLTEYPVSASAQQQYAKANFEHPVLKGVTPDPAISATIDEVDVDKMPLTEIAKHRK